MPLNYNKVTVPFVAGVNEGVDDKALQPPQNAVVQNAVFDKDGALSKRTGYTELGTSFGRSSTTAGAGAHIFAHQDTLYAYLKRTTTGSPNQVMWTLARWSKQREKWFDQEVLTTSPQSPTGTPVHITTRPLREEAAGNTAASRLSDYVYAATKGDTDAQKSYAVGFGVLNQKGLYSVYDRNTHAVLFRDVADTTTNLTLIQAVGTEDNVILLAKQDGANNLLVERVSPSAATSLNALTWSTLASNVDTLFDATEYDKDNAYVAYRSTTSNTIGVIKLDSDGASAATTTVSTAATPALVTCQALNLGGTDRLIVAWRESTTIKWEVLNLSTLASVAGPYSFSAGSSPTELTVAQDPNGVIFYMSTGVTGIQVFVRSSTNTAVINQTWYSLGVASRGWYDNGIGYVWAHSEPGDSTQSSYVLISTTSRPPATPTIAARAQVTKAAVDEISNRPLGAVIESLDNNTREWGVLTAASIAPEDVDKRSHKSVLIRAELGAASLSHASLGRGMYVADGSMAVVDTVAAIMPFHHTPYISSSGAVVSGSLASGTYTHKCVYRYTSPSGEVFRSGDSLAHSTTISSNEDIQLTIKTVQSYQDVVIEVYRTVDGGTTYYRVGHVNNSTTANTVTFTDSTVDADILDKEVLYTHAEVANTTPPATNVIATHDERLFALSADNPRVLVYSKRKQVGRGVEFGLGFTQRLPVEHDATALASSGGRLLVFTREAIYATGDVGPDNAGFGQSFRFAKVAEVGTLDHRSVAVTPLGVFFQSPSGIKLLSPSLQLSTLGREVQDSLGTIVAAEYLRERDEVIFLQSSGTALLFNYRVNAWSTFTNHSNPVAATSWEDKLVWLDSSGVAHQADTSYTDGSTSYAMTIKTAHMPLAGLLGFQRVKRVSVLGTGHTNATMTVNVRLDYNDDAADQTFTADSSTLAATTDQFQIVGHLKTQRCSAIQLEFVESAQTGTEQSFSLTGLALEVGLKPGIAKIPNSRRL
jgi:hypothetical protein